MKTSVPIVHAARVAAIMWPQFVEKGGCVFAVPVASPRFLKNWKGRYPDDPWQGLVRTGAEAFENHVHIFDLFEHDDLWSEKRSTYKTSHAHFKLAEQIGQAMAHSWCAKLRQDFPSQAFRVYYTRNDNPIVRFHRVYPGEATWLDPAGRELDIIRGHLLVLDT